MKNLSLKLKLAVGFSLASLVSLVVLGIFVYHFTSEIVQQETMNNLNTRIEGVKTLLAVSAEEGRQRRDLLMQHWGTEVAEKIQVSSAPAKELEATNQVTQEKVRVQVSELIYEGKPVSGNEFVDHLAGITDEAVTIFLNVPEGLLRVSTSVKKADGTRNVGTLIPASSAVAKAIQSGDPYIGRAKVVGRWFMTAYHPIKKNGKVIGAFFMGTPDIAVEKIMAELKSQIILETGYYFILDGKANFVLHPAKQGENVLNTQDLGGRYIFQEMISSKEGIIHYKWKNAQTGKAQEKLAIYKYIPDLDWHITASLNQAEADAPLVRLRWIMFVVTLCAVAGMIFISLFIGQQISKSLQKTSDKLIEITKSTAESAGQLLNSSESLSSVSTEAAASLEETVASLEEINSQVQNNSAATQKTSKLGLQALETAKSSEKQMKVLLESMVQIRNESSKIQEMTDLIDDIAFQTNLLALNAAVEAARAGEHGRGFAVVADAVRSLALKSAESAKQISSLITENRSRVEGGLEAVTKADESFHEIVTNIENLSKLIVDISSSSNEQASGIGQINQAMNQLDSTTQLNASSAESLAGTSTQLSSQSEKLEFAVKELNQLVNGAKKAA